MSISRGIPGGGQPADDPGDEVLEDLVTVHYDPEELHPAQASGRVRHVSALGFRTALRVLAPALALGWAADALFYRNLLGISVPLFVAVLMGTLFIVARAEGVTPLRRNLWLLVPIGFFAAMVFVRTNWVLTTLNVLTTGALLWLLAYFYGGGRIEALGLLGYPAALTASFGGTLARPLPAVQVAGAVALSQRRRASHAAPVLRGVLLAVPVLLVFTTLLVSADTIFQRYLEEALDVDLFDNLPERLWRLTLITVTAWLVAGGLLVALRRHGAEAGAGEIEADAAGRKGLVPLLTNLKLGFGEAATILVLVDVLFALFVWVQFAYLFSGEAARTMHFEEYRLYARRGFGELLAVSVLTLLLIVALRAMAWRPEWRVWQAAGSLGGLLAPAVRRARVFNGLCTALVGLTLVILASAFQRMLQWEQVEYYINTGTRLYVRWSIVWLALTFVWLVVALWRRPERFAIGAFIATLGFLATMNLQDPDADVAAYNLARRDELSTRYLALLSDDAVPALAASLMSTSESGALPPELRSRIRQNLAGRLERLDGEVVTRWQQWPSFHLGRWRAHRALVELREQGAFTPAS